ncbi:hypothetical protein [Vulcanococcus limneticus]|uniref:hypothetical protein n=1 Tax=Vulcanococcus limneticus TaxID=2170428 RepID=UPI00398BC99A
MLMRHLFIAAAALLVAAPAHAGVVCGIGTYWSAVDQTCVPYGGAVVEPVVDPVVYGAAVAPRAAVYGGYVDHGDWGGTAYRGYDGGAAYRGSYGGAAVRGPGGDAAVRGPDGGAAVHTEYHGNFYRR